MTEPFKKKMDNPTFSQQKVRFCQLIMAAIACLLLIPLSAFAQNNKDAAQQTNATNKGMLYQGEVIDDDNQPLVGVSVADKDGKVVAMTDANGQFTAWLPTANATLSFSYVSMKKQSLRMQPGKRYTVRMQADAHQLGETVVTGIYTRKKESFTGSAASYRQEELKAIGNQNILQSLSALDPSFVIAENNLAGSNPNATMKVSINGTTSINGLSDAYGNDPDRPLFILDGFETTLERISDLSMDRVESITILKDAASTAIYGSKAANGVIVVETKKPEAGKLHFTYNGNFQMSWADLSDYNLMNASEKLEFEKRSGHYGLLDHEGEILNDVNRAIYYSRYERVAAGLNSYWMNEPLRLGFAQDHSFNAEGGDAAFRYGLTFRYKDNKGVMKNSGRQNIDGSLVLSYRIDKFNFTNQTHIYYTTTDNNVVPFRDFVSANPYYAKRDENGEVYKVLESYQGVNGTTQHVYNPLWDFNQKSFDRSNDLNINNNFNVEYQPLAGLRLTGRFGFTAARGTSETFKSPFSSGFTSTPELKRGSYSNRINNNTSFNGSFMASYGGMLGVHTYNIVAGAQAYGRKNTSDSYAVRGYINDQFSNPNFSNGYPEGGKPSSNIDKMRSASFYMNGNYAYDMRYLIDFNLRSDGASVFGVNNPFSTTYSVGVAWNIHNEHFFKKNNIVNNLKLRYTFGRPGNDNISAKLANNVYNYYTANANPFGLAAIVSQWGNKDLKWKRTLTHNFGLNALLLNNRLSLVVDYSIRKADPELIPVEQPTSTGVETIPMNIGATDNRSLSIALGYDVIRQKDLTWRVTANLLHATTTYYNIGDILEKLNEQGRASQSLTRYYDGASTTALWTVKSLGIDPMTGNELFLKRDGTYTYKWNANEEMVCGDTTPDAQGNLGTTIRWKGFSLGLNFSYRFGAQATLNTLLTKVENISEAAIKYNQDRRALHDRWKQPGDKAKFKRIDDTSTTNISSRFVADDNTLECNSINLGYENTTAQWLKIVGLNALYCRIYANNLFRLSTIKEERGLDYPFSRSVSASIGLRF
jgi:tonB-linked outer membrane protein, susC/ragA family